MQKARCPPRGYAITLAANATAAAAAAVGKQNDGNDDEPESAVIKQIAKTVIHNRSSIKSSREAVVGFSVIIL